MRHHLPGHLEIVFTPRKRAQPGGQGRAVQPGVGSEGSRTVCPSLGHMVYLIRDQYLLVVGFESCHVLCFETHTKTLPPFAKAMIRTPELKLNFRQIYVIIDYANQVCFAFLEISTAYGRTLQFQLHRLLSHRSRGWPRHTAQTVWRFALIPAPDVSALWYALQPRRNEFTHAYSRALCLR